MNKLVARPVVLVLVLGAVTLVSGCGSPNPVGVDLGAQRKEILETDRAFARMATDAGTAEAFCHYMNEDTLMAPTLGDFIRGREQACDSMRGAVGLVLDWKPLDAIVADNGDFGFSWGTYVMSIDNDGNREEAARGKYVSIWTKTDDGWRFIADIGNQEPPAQ